MSQLKATFISDSAGDLAMLVRITPSEHDFVCYFGSDELLTLTPRETALRDEMVSRLAASLAGPVVAPEVPEVPAYSMIDRIQKDPILVSIGFAIGIIVAAGAIHAITLIV